MAARFVLLGAEGMLLEEAMRRMEATLGVSFEERESSFKGGRYYRANAPVLGEVLVERNHEDDDGDLAEPGYPDFPVLVYINSPSGFSDNLIPDVPGVSLLRSESLD